ncbi:alpha-1,2-fucosyltransferase [Pedobacter jeongneungensis]|uniref:Alpha-1,2-fucosyltransferase n=1 Tax=Pedobacter jeongneungensis TaxID=947309 RepID=A0ABP8B3G1_9SPHI
MISIELQGRLGNQLFQYAFAYATAKKLNSRFYFDRRLQSLFIPKYFAQTKDIFYYLDQTIFSLKGFDDFFSVYLKQKFYALLRKTLNYEKVYISDQLEPQLESLKLNDQKLFTGFFQSEYYFAAYKEEIKAKLVIKEKYQTDFRNIFNDLPQGYKYVVIHVRRSDYFHYDIQLPAEYYHNAISSIESENNYYILISDDTDFLESEFGYLNKKYISRSTEIIDFQFLMQADICIISNSTFSWWGAYLNVKNAPVYVPNKWFPDYGKIESPCNILLDNWNLIQI